MSAVAAQAAAAGAQRMATKQANAAERTARELYQARAHTVRALFPIGAPERVALGVHGRTPTNAAALTKAAMTLFNNAANVPEVAATLARYGYDTQALQHGLAVVGAYRDALTAQASARGDALQATAAQNATVTAL